MIVVLIIGILVGLCLVWLGISNVPPIRMDVYAYCEGCGMYRDMIMTAYPDEITFRCKFRSKDHVYRYVRSDKLPDWFGRFAPPKFGEDDDPS